MCAGIERGECALKAREEAWRHAESTRNEVPEEVPASAADLPLDQDLYTISAWIKPAWSTSTSTWRSGILLRISLHPAHVGSHSMCRAGFEFRLARRVRGGTCFPSPPTPCMECASTGTRGRTPGAMTRRIRGARARQYGAPKSLAIIEAWPDSSIGLMWCPGIHPWPGLAAPAAAPAGGTIAYAMFGAAPRAAKQISARNEREGLIPLGPPARSMLRQAGKGPN